MSPWSRRHLLQLSGLAAGACVSARCLRAAKQAVTPGATEDAKALLARPYGAADAAAPTSQAPALTALYGGARVVSLKTKR